MLKLPLPAPTDYDSRLPEPKVKVSLDRRKFHPRFFPYTGDGSILEINNAACRMFIIRRAELKKLKRWDFYRSQRSPAAGRPELREKNGFAMTEATGIRKDGERFPRRDRIRLFIDTDGIRKTSTTVTDITERRKIKQAIEESEQRYRMRSCSRAAKRIRRIDLR